MTVSLAASAASDPGMDKLLARVLEAVKPRAGGFIVTIFGDVVEPRGNRLWMGTLIEVGERAGLSETLVRTAVSRLVGAGKLEGAREGRRSYYRLTEPARQEFLAAARSVFEPVAAQDWAFVWVASDAGEAVAPELEAAGLRRLGPQLFVAPGGRAPCGPGLLVFRAASQGPDAALRDFASRTWDLAAHDAGYAAFLEMFGPVAAALEGAAPSPGAALLLRLLLVHAFRRVALADPSLPPAALPADWHGAAARRLFARLYLGLSGGANAAIAGTFRDGARTLARATRGTQAREAALSAWLAGAG